MIRKWCDLLVVGLLPVVALAIGGCDAIKQDFSGLRESIVPPKPAQAAQWMLDPYDAENRRRGTTLIANSPGGGAEANVRLYRDRVQNETNPQVLAISMRALGRHGQADDALLIAKGLTHPVEQVRLESAKALQRLHHPDVVKPMWSRLVDENEDPDVRAELATALGQYPEEDVFQALATALDQRELEVNNAAHDSLATLTGQDFGLDRASWLQWRRSAGDPFASQKQYLYPTYRRKLRLLDRLNIFWPVQWESPAPPAGLVPQGTRSTYEGSGV